MINAQIARFILKEHKHKPIAGDVLLIGRQTVAMTFAEATALLLSEGIDPRYSGQPVIDRETVAAKDALTRGVEYITDKFFFSMFTDATVKTLDESDYEGADVIWDINRPIEYGGLSGLLNTQIIRSADFIFNGSCLDNLFDPAQAMRNLSAMLRPDGRILSFEHGSIMQSAYLAYSPEWFWGFYAANDYADCVVWRANLISRDPNTKRFSMQGDWQICGWAPDRFGHGDIIVCLAEKGRLSTNDRTPKQEHYRAMHGDEPGRKYESSRRFKFPNGLSKAMLPWR